jgi:hypothetical protein
MNFIKDKKRASLKSNTLEDLIRIKENGVKILGQFNATYYAKAWYDSGNLLSDDESKRGGNIYHFILSINF